MYKNKNNVTVDATTGDDQGRNERRVLVVGRILTGSFLASLLEDEGFDVTVVPSPTTGSVVDERETVDDSSPKSIDSNQLGVCVEFGDGETEYFDLAVDATGNWQFRDGQDPRRVAVVSPLYVGAVRETAIALATLTVLADAIADSASAPAALEQYRQWREAFTNLNSGPRTNYDQ